MKNGREQCNVTVTLLYLGLALACEALCSVDFALSYSNENSLSQCHHLSSVHHAKKVLPKFATPFRKQVWKHRFYYHTCCSQSRTLWYTKDLESRVDTIDISMQLSHKINYAYFTDLSLEKKVLPEFILAFANTLFHFHSSISQKFRVLRVSIG